MSGPPCPQCKAAIQPDWDWCHVCGFDPEGLRPADWVAPLGGTVVDPARGAAAPGTGPRPEPGPAAGGPQFASPGSNNPPGPVSGPGGSPGAGAPFGVPGMPGAPGAGGGYGVPPPYGGPAGQASYGYPSGPPQKSGAGRVVAIVVSVVLLLLCLPVAAIGAVTFLGRSASSKFSVVGSATDDPTAGFASASDPWKTTNPAGGGYTFEMPGTPRRDTKKVGGPGASVEVEYYSLATDKELYVIASSKLPPGYQFPPDPGQALDGELDGLAAGMGAVVTGRDVSAFAGNPARQVTLQQGQFTGKCLSFVAGTRFVDACLLGDPEYKPENYDKLLAGIHIK